MLSVHRFGFGIVVLLYQQFVGCWDVFAQQLLSLSVETINLFVGFSTGHVGTTTLSNSDSYINFSQPTIFIFERGAIKKGEYAESSLEHEVEHVKKIYGRYIIAQIKVKCGEMEIFKAVNVVDLSHSSLFFYRGLIEVAKEYEKIKLHFVRIRRDRLETALSLNASSKSQPDFFKYDHYRYSPIENVPNVVLALDESAWSTFSLMERVFWASLLVVPPHC